MDVDQQITVVLPTSPIHSHPDTSVIDETIGSIRERLPRSEVILCCDGPHPSLDAERVAAYSTYLQRVAFKAQHEWGPCLPVIFGEHAHQVRMTKHALGLVRTPYIQWAEHDTPLVGDFPYPEAVAALASGQVNLIRQYHETVMQPDHEPLMISPVIDVEGIPVRKTVQFSARPHLATAGFYRSLMEAEWWQEHDGMLEDRCWGYIHEAYRQHGEAGWSQYKLSVWVPPGDNMQGSRHLDGRGGADKITLRGG